MTHLRIIVCCFLVSLVGSIDIVHLYGAQEDKSAIGFRDDFVGTKLNPKWNLLAPDKDRMTLIDGEYLLIVTTGVSGHVSNTMQLDVTLPDAYEITLKVQTPPQYENQVVRLLIEQENGDNVRIGYHPGFKPGGAALNQYTQVFFMKRLRGKDSKLETRVNHFGENEPLYLKLRKEGIEYTAEHSSDGSKWVKVGTHIFLNLVGKPAFQTYNVETRTTRPPESGIRFDYFELRNLGK